jgi:hypothetical protein
MPATRSGSKYTVGPQHHGRYAKQNGVFSNNKREVGPRRTTRFQTGQREVKRIKLANPSPPTPTREDIIGLERATRGGNPTCLHFGLEKEVREFLHPDYFFCGHCDDYVDAMIHSTNKKNIKRTSRQFICQGDHTNFIAPTTLKSDKQHFRLLAEEIEEEDVDAEETSVGEERGMIPATPATRATRPTVTPATSTPAPVPPSVENDTNDILRSLRVDYETLLGKESLNTDKFQALDLKIKELSAKLQRPPADRLQQRYDDLQQKYNDLVRRHQNLIIRIEDPKGLVTRAINLPFDNAEEFDGSDACVDDTKIKKDKKLKKFVEMLTQTNYLEGRVRDEILVQAKCIIREEIYTPWKILRLKDKSGAKLSIDTIDILRTLETDGVKYVRGTILCGSATIKRVAKIVERFADSFVPYKVESLDAAYGKGEVISFGIEQVLPVVLRATHLYEAARVRRIECPQSSDATNITKNVSFIIYGVKIKDRAAVCPITKRPLFLPAADGVSGPKTFIQNAENCIPIKIIIGKETKELVNAELKENFAKLAKEDALGQDDTSFILGEGFKPLISPCDADKKMHWAGLGIGGAAKVCKLSCSCCAIKSDDLAVPNSTLCQRWCQQWEKEGKLDAYPNWRCHHKAMVTPARIAEMREESETIHAQLGDLAEKLEALVQDSSIDCAEDPRGVGQGNAIQDPSSIHFDHTRANAADKNAYLTSLGHDLTIRNLDATGTINEMQERLKKALILEYVLREIENDIAHGTISQRSALYLIINAIPCILHLENRVGLKIFTRLLRIGLDNVKEGMILGTDEGENVRIKAYLESIQTICNTTVWGTEERPVRWTCPYDTATKKITTICLDNEKTRKVINALDSLVDECIPEDGEGRQLWKSTIELYREALILLLIRHDLTDAQIFEFQWKVDQFTQGWFKINMGDEGVTNYIHDLHAGHISDYLFHWRNLYTHSQQGWENMNFAIKKYWFRCTNRGGGKGGGNRLEPMARWLQRRFVWMMGFEYEQILEAVKNGTEVDLDNVEGTDEML